MQCRLAFLTLLLAHSTSAAVSDVALFGTILDPSGASAPNAQVTAFNDEIGVRRSTTSDQEGFYAIGGLPPGRYKLLVRKEGFLTAARSNLTLGAQQNARCDFVLQVGPVEEIVTVEGTPSLLLAEPHAPGIVLGRSLMDQLPLGGRSLAGMLDLVPGVIPTPANTGESGQFSASGQRPNTNYFTVDGVSVNTGVSGAGIPGQFPGGTLPAMTAIGSLHDLAPLDAVDEVRVETSSFAPESGRMPGAQVAIHTRTGTNDFHGSIFESFNQAALNANDWFANASGLARPAMRSNDFGGSAGGPVRHNRTFFFVAAEQIDLRQPLVWRTAVPSMTARASAPTALQSLLAAFPIPTGPDLTQGLSELAVSTTRPARAFVGSARVDHALTPRINIFARYSNSPSWSEFGYSQVNRSDFHQDSLTAGLAAAITPKLTGDLRANRSTATVRSNWTSSEAGGAGPFALGGGIAFESFSINGMGSLNTGDAGRNSQDQTNVVGSLGLRSGNHRFRFGADYEHLAPSRDGPSASLSLNFVSLASLLSGGAGSDTYARSNAVSTDLNTVSVFAQDTWTVTPKLTMTYGVRWDLAPAPVAPPTHAVYAVGSATPLAGGHIWQGGFSNVAPRVGLAYRMTDDARSVVRAGFGVFYDTGFAASTDEINGAPYNSFQLGLPYGASGLNSGPAVLYGFASNLRLPRSLEWNAGWQHAWADRATSSISYVGSRDDRLLRREGQIAPAPNVAELELATSNGSSTYHGLQADYRQRLVDGLEGILSYTWSHSIDTGSWDSPVYLVQPGLSAPSDRASSNFDARHSFAAALSYGWSGWTLDAAFRARSGFPIDVLAAETYAGLNFANVVRPNLAPGAPVWIGRFLNPAAFLVPAGTVEGELGRNAIRGFGITQLDLALHRRFALGERASFELRAEFANALNHPNFADPERYLASPLFGESTSMLNLMLGSGTPRSGLTPAFQLGGPRVIQIGVKFGF